MERKVGTISRGIRCPIIREGDDLVKITVDSVLDAAASEGFSLRDRDVVALTESIVARAQGNYASIDAITKDVKNKMISTGEIKMHTIRDAISDLAYLESGEGTFNSSYKNPPQSEYQVNMLCFL